MQVMDTRMLYLWPWRKPWRLLYLLSCAVFLLCCRYGLLMYLVWTHSLRVVLAQNDSMCMIAVLYEQKNFMVTIHQRSYLSRYTCILKFYCAIVLLPLKIFQDYVIGFLDKIQAIIRMIFLVLLIFFWYNFWTVCKHLHIFGFFFQGCNVMYTIFQA